MDHDDDNGDANVSQWLRQPLTVKLRQGNLNELDALFPQGFLFVYGGGPPDVPSVFLSMMNPEGDFRKLFANVIEVLINIFLKFPEGIQRRLAVLRCCRSSGTVVPSPDRDRRGNQYRFGISAHGTGDEFLRPLFLEGAPVLEPTLKFMAVAAFEIIDDQDFSPEIDLLVFFITIIFKTQTRLSFAPQSRSPEDHVCA
jgi:hypothetical protein